MLVAKGRLVLDRDVLLWLQQALAVRPVDLAPLTPEIAARSAALGIEFPGDPADRIIAATARQQRAPLVTRDARLQAVTDLVTVW